MSSKLPCAVVGVGYLGRFHAQKYQIIEQQDANKCNLVGVYDIDHIQAQKVANELNTKVFSSLDELASKAKAVTIASATSSHFEIAKFLIDKGIHVHIEKPITAKSSDAIILCNLAKEKNVKLQVGHIERFNPALQSAQKNLEHPLFLECHRLSVFKGRSVDVNVVLDLMIHDIDVILSIVRSPVSKISAVGTPVITKEIDIANARIEFESGTVANVTASRVSSNSIRKFRVFKPNHYLSIDFEQGTINLVSKTCELKSDGLPTLESQTWGLDKSDSLLEETQSFVDAILLDRPCLVTGEDGLIALQVAEKIIDDIERRHPIRSVDCCC